MTVPAKAEMSGHRLRVVLAELFIQKFPEPNQYVLTFHTPYPLATSLLVAAGNRTADSATWFLQTMAGLRNPSEAA
jgi:hypothetical protein